MQKKRINSFFTSYYRTDKTKRFQFCQPLDFSNSTDVNVTSRQSIKLQLHFTAVNKKCSDFILFIFDGMQMSRIGSPSVGMEDDVGVGHVLSDFLLQLENYNYNPSIPDSVVAHYLNMSGFESQDPRLIRLIALASQKFLSDIANDALQHCKMRTSSQITQSSKNPKGPKEKKYVMTMEDLAPALQEYGITARKPHYFV